MSQPTSECEICYIDMLIESTKDQVRNAIKCINSDSSQAEWDEICLFISPAEYECIRGSHLLSLSLSYCEYEAEDKWQDCNLPPNVYYRMGTIGSEHHWTNDVYGKYFIYPYFVDTGVIDGTETEGEFQTEEEAVAFVNQHMNDIPSDLKSLDEISSCLSEHDQFFYYHYVAPSVVCTPKGEVIINKILNLLR